MSLDEQFRLQVDEEHVKTCTRCGRSFMDKEYLKSKSILSEDGRCPVCNECLTEFLKENDYAWEVVDSVCRELNIPFVPSRFEEIRKLNKDQPFVLYAQLLQEEKYSSLDWKRYYDEFKKLEDAGVITSELPLLSEGRRRELHEKWGPGYDDEALNYLENLHKGLLKTQNVIGALQDDQSLKLCKISFEIDQRIAEGADVDKLLASYSKLVDIAQFTPKHAKNANDFDSIGEIFKWCEKRGWKNQYYDGVPKDIVDETMANIQNFNRKLWVNEAGIGDEVQKRLEILKATADKEHYYDIQEIEDFDAYDNEGYEELDNLFKEDSDDFVAEGGETI